MRKHSIWLLLLLVGCSYVDDAKTTIFNETKASTLLRKYEWFKNAAARLDSLKATADTYNHQLLDAKEQMNSATSSIERTTILEQSNQWRRELAGIKATYNSLAAEYNAQMSKENWRFCNVGRMPRGLENQPALPREFAPYIFE